MTATIVTWIWVCWQKVSSSEGEGYGAEGGDDGSTAVAQSIQTGATAGSDALFSDDESAESSHPEDKESDAGEADEQWAEGFTFNEEQLNQFVATERSKICIEI